MALWVAHTWAIDFAYCTPYLHIHSTEAVREYRAARGSGNAGGQAVVDRRHIEVRELQQPQRGGYGVFATGGRQIIATENGAILFEP